MQGCSRRHFLTSLATLALPPIGASKSSVLKWKKYEALSLVANRYYDGDSFHLHSPLHRGTLHLRLYGADCPESDAVLAPKRLEEQMSYFGVSRSRLLQWAQISTAFTEVFLRDSVIAYTAKVDAHGQSETPRYYAYIFRGSESLAESLIQSGLARSKGFLSDFQGETWQQIRKRYQSLENKAKAEKRGIWSAT